MLEPSTVRSRDQIPAKLNLTKHRSEEGRCKPDPRRLRLFEVYSQ